MKVVPGLVLFAVMSLMGCGGTDPDQLPVAEDAVGQAEQATFNPCACIDLSQVSGCSGSTCNDYCRSGSTTFSCEGRSVTCPRYVGCHYCRQRNYAPAGLPCCSGRQQYAGSGRIVCA